MNHYSGHVREAFIEWAEQGFPETATIEVNYEPVKEPAEAFLRRFLDCTDIMPRETAQEVADQFHFPESAQGLTYAVGAAALIVNRTSGPIAAQSFLEGATGSV